MQMGGLSLHKSDQSNEYLLTFTSVYKAMHAGDQLRRYGIVSAVERIPAGLSQSCGHGLHVKREDLRRTLGILNESGIHPRKVFEILLVHGRKEYKQVKP